jgi:hypothetical protein
MVTSMPRYAGLVWGLALVATSGLRAQERVPRDTSAARGLPIAVQREAVALFNAAALRARGRTEIEAGRTVASDMAVLDGPLVVAGQVTGRVVAINADVILRPTGQVNGDLIVVGGEVEGLREGAVRGETRVYRDPLRYVDEGDRLAVRSDEDDDRGGRDFWRRWERRRANALSGIHVGSAGAFNRVEGLPVNVGARLRQTMGDARLALDAFAVLRTESSFRSDSSNVGYDGRLELRPRRRGVAVGARAYDVNAPVESWQLSELETGLAAFLAKRDYRDYYGRRGGGGYVALVDRYWGELSLSYAHEHWRPVGAGDPWSLLHGNGDWRANPSLDEGRMHLTTLAGRLDTRNDAVDPRGGWLVLAELEHGRGRLSSLGATSPGVRSAPVGPEGTRARYSRAFVDVRRYGRLSPHGQVNLRGVLGGWVGGDELPLQRRLSVDGPGSLPGSGFRRERGLTTGPCVTDPAGGAIYPAQCERIALGQIEFRGDLRHEVNVYGFRAPGPAEWVVFGDAGRGWLVRGSAPGSVGYASDELPPLSTFRADVGLGIDVGGIVGLYLAKAVSHGEPPVAFVRLRRRF